jgi:hypothetical protein
VPNDRLHRASAISQRRAVVPGRQPPAAIILESLTRNLLRPILSASLVTTLRVLHPLEPCPRSMQYWRALVAYGHGGLTVSALAGLAGLLLTLPARSAAQSIDSSQSVRPICALIGAAFIPVAAELVLTTWYLFSPTYVDHIEASVASLTHYFLQGRPLYPALDSYTFHGLLYGPLLTEVNSLGYLFGAGTFASKLIGWLAAWSAIGLLALSHKPAERGWMWTVSLAWVACILCSFGSVLTANRADPLLLLCAAAALASVVRTPSLLGLTLAAALAGAAADLKLHGPLYVMPALYLWTRENLHQRSSRWSVAGLIAVAAGLAGAAIPFTPSNISFAGYLVYLQLAAKHGLRWDIFEWNFAFLLSMWAPILVAAVCTSRDRRLLRSEYCFGALLAGLELVVTLIASKPGAGAHHLLPFLGFHALLLRRLLAQLNATHTPSQTVRVAVASLTVALIGTAWPAGSMLLYLLKFDLEIPAQTAERDELQQFARRYPRGMLGVAGADSYDLTNFRPWLTALGTRQTDYGAWMDLNLSGVSDAPLVTALDRCDIPYIYIPRDGAAFAMPNRYGGQLFSDEVRARFALRYSFIESGRYFTVFRCVTHNHDNGAKADPVDTPPGADERFRNGRSQTNQNAAAMTTCNATIAPRRTDSHACGRIRLTVDSTSVRLNWWMR